ncbi:hypothetical protein EON80_06725 [bacterium]|nr:MAG: hypothetical protein EON80_06725 [bacterium]
MQHRLSNPVEFELSPEEREMARRLWDACASSTTPAQQAAGREAMQAAPEVVRSAILLAHAAIWRMGRNPQFGKNPFE